MENIDIEKILVLAATAMVLAALTPVLSGLYQYSLLPFSVFFSHFERTDLVLPRLVILIPAWNEESVIGTTVDRLMQLDYPRDRLRICIIDDGSTDQTPSIAIEKAKLYRDNVFHVRRVCGGEGKAHTLNYGLRFVFQDAWAEAVLIMDADVIYRPDALRKMARHLADPDVGAVTAYIKEGSASPNYVQRFVTFEYITATGVGRRAQNVLGFLVCLSGGAQLHSRENLEAIGGQLFSDTLAEDTFTTFESQLKGRRVLFEPNAVVLAEEPDGLVGLWKQRIRWARGNVQITSEFRRLWLNRSRHPRLGSLSFSLIWFSIMLMPVFQIGAAASLIALYFLDAHFAWTAFRALWIISGISYLVVTLCSLVIDPESARKSWLEGVLFPGVVSLGLIIYSLVPGWFDAFTSSAELHLDARLRSAATLLTYSWLALSMATAYAAKAAEEHLESPRLSQALLYLGGFGSFLCAVTFAAVIKEVRGADRTWDKTEKTGKVAAT